MISFRVKQITQLYSMVILWLTRRYPVFIPSSSDIDKLSQPFESHPDTMWPLASGRDTKGIWMYLRCITISVNIRGAEQTTCSKVVYKASGKCGGVWGRMEGTRVFTFKVGFVPKLNQTSQMFCNADLVFQDKYEALPFTLTC